jgi:hypothetical protein
MGWIYRINGLPRPEKEGFYRILIPPLLYKRFNIDPLSLGGESNGKKAIRFFCPQGDGTCLVEVKLQGLEEPLYSIQLSDSDDLTQINWDFLVVNDPASLYFKTHLDQEGKDTLFGWAARNLGEEEKAMRAGLFPGQMRKGLRLTREALRVLEFFCGILDLKSIRLEALFYHNAITYERYGFGYFSGYRQMRRIHALFQPGEKLFAKMDNSTPFRRPESAQTVRGRSWAIHDGILAEVPDEFEDGWCSPVMYRMVDKPRAMTTFPNPVY